jgi:RHS repeat-associated protein
MPTGGGSAIVEYQHTDALGTPVAVTDGNRKVVERNEYEPYGRLVNKAARDGVGFTGHVEDAATGLVYMQQRYMDPMYPRFLSVDPVAVDTTTAWNLCRYCYAANNPYKYRDPDGRIIDTIADIGFIAYSGYKLATEPTWTNAAALGADIVGAAIPGLTGVGAGIRSAAHGQNALEATKKSTIAQNAAQGKKGEALTRAHLENKVAGEQVTMKTSDGTVTRADFITKDGGVVETKTGGAQLSRGQAKLKADIDAGRAVTPVGNNAAKAGLPVGQPTVMNSCTVDRPDC